MREARIHVRHIRDLLKSLDPSDAYNGVDCNSLSFLSIFTDGDLGGMTLMVDLSLFEQWDPCLPHWTLWGLLDFEPKQKHFSVSVIDAV